MLASGEGVEGRVRDLAARESGCCSFFTFTFTVTPATGGDVHLDVEVDPPHEGVLEAPRVGASAEGGLRVSGEGLRSGQVAEAAGVNVQTLRYYERRGLLAEPDLSPGGHRLYDEDAVTARRLIKAALRLGFSLEEAAELLENGRQCHGRPVPGLQERAQAKLAEVDAKITDLTTIREALTAAVAAGCDDLTLCATSSCCPIPFTDLTEEMRHGRPCC
ncbi:MerR family transcriptional regulator [Streptomyces sp. NPDC005251]|uniref:MerR family transcriptional regulator n=1 Tax=Streptomyces sp. NPDC005251 TaxID=3157166 RepID=UPI0033B8E828